MLVGTLPITKLYLEKKFDLAIPSKFLCYSFTKLAVGKDIFVDLKNILQQDSSTGKNCIYTNFSKEFHDVDLRFVLVRFIILRQVSTCDNFPKYTDRNAIKFPLLS